MESPYGKNSSVIINTREGDICSATKHEHVKLSQLNSKLKIKQLSAHSHVNNGNSTRTNRQKERAFKLAQTAS